VCNASVRAETLPPYNFGMATTPTISAEIARLGSLLADQTRAEILCALMDGRAHTGSELARHVAVAPSTVSEHLSKLLDADIVAVEPQGRHRYWRLADPDIAQLLEGLGATTRPLAPPRVPADLAHARTCYDHLAGELAVAIYDQLLAAGHLTDNNGQLVINPSGYELLASIGGDVTAIHDSKRPKARACLDWTQRRHHLAGAAGAAVLSALIDNDWVKRGNKPRSLRITNSGRARIRHAFGLQA
jgi:DNA-binding transcriptional ArsR family regulator